MSVSAYREEISSQIPAAQLLINLGWQYLTPAEALALRGGKERNVVLTGVLEPWLRGHNQIRTKGQAHAFSDANIGEALDRLVNEPLQSLIVTNERIYELLTLGTSMTQTIDGDRKSYALHYIDWQHPEHNVFHVTEEFSVERQGSHQTRRPDLVLFVNGIPLVIIECKRPDLDLQGEKAVAEAVSQMLRNQDEGEIPQLFALVRLVNGNLAKGERRADIITTVINKFDQLARQKVADAGSNIFVLVDESHRSQYGTMHAKMQQVFPNACFIGFTGTPLTKAEKSTAKKFGDFIHKYPMRQAVADQAVVPLLYEGRIVEQNVDKDQLERWFERTTRHLSDEQKADLKRRMSSSEAINATEQRIKEIAYNIAEHYIKNWRGTGFKAQLASASKRIGLKYLRYLKAEGIQVALVVSPPDTREGHEEVGEEAPEVQVFWKQMMDRYGSEETYNREVVASFGRADGIEILIVVDKLLTGFDEPRNTVLYIDKPLKEHTLLQAIARVNRLFERKDFGHIIDYRGVLGELNEAMNLYDALAEYDAEDIAGTMANVGAEIARLPQLHSDLWAVFTGVANPNDREALERHLEPEDRRQRFYEALTDFAQTLRVDLSSVTFYETTPEARIQHYKDDLRFFHHLRQIGRCRTGESGGGY